MAQHARLKIDTGLQVYFRDPRSPRRRGTNENTIRTAAFKVDSTGCRNIGVMGVAMGIRKLRSKRLGWPPLMSPGRPPVADREERHLSLAKREELAILRVQGAGMREIAR